MAVTSKELAKVLKEIPEDKLDDAANRLGFDADALKQFVAKPTAKGQKAFGAALLEKVGNTIEGIQEFVNQVRTPASMEVSTKFTPQSIKPKTNDYSFPANIGKQEGPTVPGPLSIIQQNLQDQAVVAKDAVTGAPMSVVPAGRKEAFKKAATGTAVVGTAAPAGFVIGQEGAKAILGDTVKAEKPISEDPSSGQVTQAAQIEKPADLGTATDMAVNSGAIAPEQAEQIKANVEKVKTVEDLIKEVRDENKREKTRLEWLRAIETIAHGLATAIGANALMNRGSPFAVDFSKGPQVDWESQFNRLQKDFDTQINAILKDEELQQKQKQFEAREARRAQEREEDVALKREAMDIRAQEAGITAEERKQAKQEKLAADATKSIETVLGLDPEKDANRLVTARGTMLKTARQLLGPDELNAMAQQAAQNAAEKAGITTKAIRSFKEFLGMKSEPGKKDYALSTVEFAKLLNQKLSGEEPAPAPQAAQAAPASEAEEMVTVSVDGQLGQIPKSKLEEFKKQYPNAEVK